MQLTIQDIEKYIKSHFLSAGDADSAIKLILLSCPKHPNGVHLWLLNASRVLQCKLGKDKAYTRAALVLGSSECGRIVTEKELNDAIEASFRNRADGCQFNVGGIKPNDTLIADQLRTSKLTVDSWTNKELRKVVPYDALRRGIFTLDHLITFAWDEYDNCKAYKLDDRELWKRDYPNWLVPNPVIGETGLTKGGKGKASARAGTNVNKRMYLVVEWDHFTHDEQAKLIGLLPTERIRMIIDTAGVSLHCWLYVGDLTEADIKPFRETAIMIGCCSGSINNKVQLVRMPNVYRPDTGKMQKLIYLYE